MSVWSRFKRWLTGGGSTSNSSRPSSNNRSSTTRASRVSNYGGGGSRSVRNYNSRTRRYYEDRESEQQTSSANTETRQQRTTNAFASISKRTDALSSGNSISNYADSKKSNLDRVASQAGTGNGTTRALARIAEKTAERTKANPPDAKLKQSQIKDAKAIRRNTSKALKEFTEADYEKNTNALIKSGDYERMPRAKNMNTPSAENRADLRVTPQGLERRMQDPAYKRLLSASRGAAGGSTWLATNVLLAGDKNDEYDREMERVYQENKSRGAETAGELVGSLASFGIGAGPAQTLAKSTGNVALKAGGKAASKIIGKDVGELTVERGAQWAAEKLANNPLTRKAAEKELKLAIKKGLVKGADDIAKNEYIQKFAAKRATKLVNALGAEAALNLTGVAMMDVNRASLEHEIGSDEWWDELKRAAKTNAALSSVLVVAPALRARGGLPFVGGVRKDTKELLANLAKNGDSPTARQAMREAFTREGDEAGRRIDLNDLLSKNSPFRQADEAVRPQAVEPPRKIGFHAGDGGKAEWYSNQAGSRRGTGHYGTGTYFAGSEDILSREGYGDRPLNEINFSNYNLYRPQDSNQGFRVHDRLKQINVGSNDVEGLAKKFSLNKESSSKLMSELDNAKTIDDLESIANRVYSDGELEDIERAARERFEAWEAQNARVPDNLSDDTIDDLIMDDLDSIDFSDIDSVESFIRRSESRARNTRIEDATYERAYFNELEETLREDLEKVREHGGEFDGWIDDVANDLGVDREQVEAALKRTREKLKGYNNKAGFLKEDSASTIFMKELGFEGVDVTGLEGLDNTEFGSVIYDLRPEDMRLVREGKPRKPPVKSAAKVAAQNTDDVARAAANNVDEAVERAAAETVERNADDVARAANDLPEEYRIPESQEYVRELEEKGETWLGQHGHITANEDGTYNLFRNGIGDETLSKEEATSYIKRARDALEAEERNLYERTRVTRTTPLNEAENARISEIDNEAERLRAESADDAKQLKDNKYKDTEGYWERQGERARREHELQNEKDNIVRKEPPTKAEQQKAEPPQADANAAEAEARTEPPNIKEETVNAEPAKAEPPRPTANESSGKIPTEEVRKMQTREESEKLMQDYFNEYGEADLGKYGKISKADGDKYKVSIEGVGEETITREEAEKRIHNAVKRAYRDSRQVNDIGEVTNAQKEHVTMRQKINNMLKYFHMEMVDSLHPYENLERGRAKAAKRQVNYGPIDALRRYMTTANYSAGTKQLKINNDAYDDIVKSVGADGKEYVFENGKSLKDIFKGMDKETEHDFNTYLLSKHAPYRLLQDKPVFEGIVDKAEHDFDDAQVCMETAERLLKKHPEFAERAEWIYQYARNELNNRVEAGLLKQEVVDDWLRKYPYYVPTGRDGFNEIHGVISGNTVSAEGLKTASGSSFDIRSIRDQLENATTRNWRDISTNNLFRDMFGDKIAADLAEEADGGVQMVLDNSVLLHRHENRYFADIFDHEGNKHAVEIGEEYYKGLNDLYKNGRIGVALVDTLNDAFAKVSGVWKKLITEWSPIFMVTNGMKDNPEAILNSKQTREYIRCMPRALKDLATGGEYSTALKRMGISQSTFVDLEKAIAAKETGENLLLRANAAVELFPRLTEFMATFEKANTPLSEASIELRQRAAANAADVTVNFGRSGSVGKLLNRGYVPFFNPSMQGWSKFVRNFSEQPTAKSMLKYITMATVLGNAPNTINNFVLRNNPNYQMISARDKATNYIIPVTKGDATMDTTDTFVKIPQARFLSVMGLPSVNAFNENKMGWAEAFKIANGQVGPVDPLESTLFSPFIDAGRNESWYGSPIVPGALENRPKPEQYDANTTWLGKKVGEATENLPKELQISPKKFDYILDQETGIFGDVLMPMMTPSRQGSGNIFGETDSPALKFAGEKAAKYGPTIVSPLKKAFTIDSTTRNDLSSRFYDQLQEANTNKQSIHATEEDAAEYKRLNSYSNELSTISKAITELQNGTGENKQENIRGLQKVRNQLMLDALNGNDAPAQAKTVDAVQKYVGTSYAISNFGSSSDKEAMKVYGLAKYGKLSDEDMAKKIDADKDFYKGVQAIGNLEDQAAKSGVKTNTTLSKAVALASIGASDDLYGAYAATKKSRTESADKMTRAKTYMSTGGSTNEFVKLESARKSMGKLSDYDKEAELDKINDQLAKGEITQDEYYTKQGEINYNANISYVGLATSLAEANAPERGYRLYDIKDKNIQKGINLAAMGYTARDYREMAKAVDANGNGYPSKQEIVDYVANSDVEDKATLFDALYYYKSSKNPFGTPTNYTREQAAMAGKSKGVDQITDEKGDISLNAEQSSSGSSGYKKSYRRRGYSRRGYSKGSSKKAELPKAKEMKASQFVKGEALVSKKSSSSSKKAEPPKLKRVQAKIDLPNKKR